MVPFHYILWTKYSIFQSVCLHSSYRNWQCNGCITMLSIIIYVHPINIGCTAYSVNLAIGGAIFSYLISLKKIYNGNIMSFCKILRAFFKIQFIIFHHGTWISHVEKVWGKLIESLGKIHQYETSENLRENSQLSPIYRSKIFPRFTPNSSWTSGRLFYKLPNRFC